MDSGRFSSSNTVLFLSLNPSLSPLPTAAAAAPFMTVTTAEAEAGAGAGPEGESAIKELNLQNPDGVSEAAIKDGLDLYHRIMACEDPNLRGALQSAIQVQLITAAF